MLSLQLLVPGALTPELDMKPRLRLCGSDPWLQQKSREEGISLLLLGTPRGQHPFDEHFSSPHSRDMRQI